MNTVSNMFNMHVLRGYGQRKVTGVTRHTTKDLAHMELLKLYLPTKWMLSQQTGEQIR
jgi:hypothetical protein